MVTKNTFRDRFVSGLKLALALSVLTFILYLVFVSFYDNYASLKYRDYPLFRDFSGLLKLPTGGRVEIWVEAFSKIDIHNLLGYGVQGDRTILAGKSAHNGFLYALMSGGVFGFIAFCALYIASLGVVLVSGIRAKNAVPLEFTEVLSGFIISCLLVRVFYETGFAIFGIDYILLLMSIFSFSSNNYQVFATR